MICREFEELSGAYALNAVTAEERSRAEEHLARCPRCAQRLQELRSVVDLLSMPIADIEPPPALKKRILATITAEEQAQTHTSPVQPPSVRSTPITLTTPDQGPHTSLAILASAAILVLALMGGMIIWNVSLQQQLASRSTGESQNYLIHSTTANVEAVGQLSYFPEQNLIILVMYGLPTPEGNQVYQGWLLQGEDPTSMGLLEFQNGIAIICFQGAIYNYDSTAISLEPGPDASKNAPRGQIVAQGALKT